MCNKLYAIWKIKKRNKIIWNKKLPAATVCEYTYEYIIAIVWLLKRKEKVCFEENEKEIKLFLTKKNCSAARATVTRLITSELAELSLK